MYCPECKSENSDSAKFCKKCGTPLKNKPINHETVINNISKEKASSDNTTKIIIVALIIVAVVLAGVFAFIGFGNQSDDSQAADTPEQSTINQDNNTQSQSAVQAQAEPQNNMEIIGGSFSTGSSLEDKTYASIYVGSEFAGENVQIQILYSRDGSSLNDGNMVPKTVDSSGYIDVSSADSYKYYPDYATINLYDTSGKLLDTQSVSLSPTSGTQSF